jgi:hypothetical protein
VLLDDMLAITLDLGITDEQGGALLRGRDGGDGADAGRPQDRLPRDHGHRAIL